MSTVVDQWETLQAGLQAVLEGMQIMQAAILTLTTRRRKVYRHPLAVILLWTELVATVLCCKNPLRPRTCMLKPMFHRRSSGTFHLPFLSTPDHLLACKALV